MKTDKEFPATHSMSTSWFGIDKDGKVAIIDFNENGPVPSFLGEESPESLIEDVLPAKGPDKINYLEFTDQQTLHMIDSMGDADGNHPVEFTHIVKINPDLTKRFISLCKQNLKKTNSEGFDLNILCLSAKYGVYIHDFYDWSEEDIKSLYSENILQKEISFDFWCNEEWDKENGKWIFDMDFKNIPFYHYQQPYDPGQLIERTYIPKFPFDETQLDSLSKKIALRFPFSFETQKLFQISEFTPCRSHGSSNYLKTEQEFPHRILYPSTNNQIVKVDEDTFFDAMSDTPRLLILDDYQRYSYLQLSKELPFIFYSVVFSCFRNRNNSWDRIDDTTRLDRLCELFESNRSRLERYIEIIRPYCIIAMSKAFEVIKKFYSMEDGHINISGYEIPFLTMEQAKDCIELLDRYCSMPYRGQDLKRLVIE